jgi:hypothetical protein
MQYRCKTSARRTSRTTSPTSDTSATGVVNPGSLRILLRTPGETARSQMTSVLRMLCPTDKITGDKVWNLEFGDDWKKLVFYSRRVEFYPPDINETAGVGFYISSIEEKAERSSVIIGPVSRNADATPDFEQMGSWRDVGEGHVLTRGNEIGT